MDFTFKSIRNQDYIGIEIDASIGIIKLFFIIYLLNMYAEIATSQ